MDDAIEDVDPETAKFMRLRQYYSPPAAASTTQQGPALRQTGGTAVPPPDKLRRPNPYPGADVARNAAGASPASSSSAAGRSRPEQLAAAGETAVAQPLGDEAAAAPFPADFCVSFNLTSYHDHLEDNSIRAALQQEPAGFDKWRIGLKGFCMTTNWLVQDGVEVAVKRKYAADGKLIGVYHYMYDSP